MAQGKRDLTQGKLLPRIILYALPLVATGLLQMLFHAADTVVVGRWGGSTPEECENALAAVGSCGSLINLIVNFFMGLSVGASVCTAQGIGAKNRDAVQKVVHTSVLAAVICGTFIATVGMIFAKPLLELLGTDPAVIDQAALYMRAFFCGTPASMLYNYCAGILRSDGDTKHPLIFLTVAGIVNVALNLLTVLVFHMGAVGVGIATAASHWVSSVLVILHLLRREGYCRLQLRRLRIHSQTLMQMIRIGVPAGIQNVVFSFSNVLLQSAINSFGKAVVAAYAAALNVGNFIYIAQNAFYHSTITFVGQNLGARKYERIMPSVLYNAICAVAVGGLLGIVTNVFSEPLFQIYMPDNPAGLRYSAIYASCVFATYFLCGVMEVGTGLLRGLGKSLFSMLVSIFGVCGLRVIWILTVFAHYSKILPPERSFLVLLLSYPITWAVTALANYIIGFVLLKRIKKQDAQLPLL